jgi:hypothetical protein
MTGIDALCESGLSALCEHVPENGRVGTIRNLEKVKTGERISLPGQVLCLRSGSAECQKKYKQPFHVREFASTVQKPCEEKTYSFELKP